MTPPDLPLVAAAMGRLEYVVERLHRGVRQTWWIVRPHQHFAPHCEALGFVMTPGCRVVVDAQTLCPIGILPAAPASPAGFNPYFDQAPA